MKVTDMAYSSDDPDVLERRRGGGCMTLFGLPVLLIGLLLMTFGIAYFAMDMAGGDEIALFLVGLSFFLVGGALVFWRGGWIINRRQGVLRKWWSFAVFRWTKEHPLDTLEWVRLSRRAVLDSGPKDRYFVHIGGQRLGDPIEMEWSMVFTNFCRAASANSFIISDLDRPDVGDAVTVRKEKYLFSGPAT